MGAFERSTEDVGNVICMEHVNMRVCEQRTPTVFYVEGLGLTRDPYMVVSDVNMWLNAGRNQFHLPTNPVPQVFRGTIGLVVPDVAAVRRRFARIERKLSGTQFEWQDEGETLLATCPYGNHIRVHAAIRARGEMQLGIPYVELNVPRGVADGIARFYSEVLRAPARVEEVRGERAANVAIGLRQRLLFRETGDSLPPYDGHHLAIYVADFSGPHRWLAERSLVSEESDQYQFRFVSIADPRSGEELFQLEHEVRSLTHPMFQRQWSLANRNPDQEQANYAPGRDWFMPLPTV